eukprot:4789309-Alexandrium_andersonii.AAC.1
MPIAPLLLAYVGARASGGRAVWQLANYGFRSESEQGTSSSFSGRALTIPPTCLPTPLMAILSVSTCSPSASIGRADEPNRH